MRLGERDRAWEEGSLPCKTQRLWRKGVFVVMNALMLWLQVETRLYQLIAQTKQIANEQAYQRVSPPSTPFADSHNRRLPAASRVGLSRSERINQRARALVVHCTGHRACAHSHLANAPSQDVFRSEKAGLGVACDNNSKTLFGEMAVRLRRGYCCDSTRFLRASLRFFAFSALILLESARCRQDISTYGLLKADGEVEVHMAGEGSYLYLYSKTRAHGSFGRVARA